MEVMIGSDNCGLSSVNFLFDCLLEITLFGEQEPWAQKKNCLASHMDVEVF